MGFVDMVNGETLKRQLIVGLTAIHLNFVAMGANAAKIEEITEAFENSHTAQISQERVNPLKAENAELIKEGIKIAEENGQEGVMEWLGEKFSDLLSDQSMQSMSSQLAAIVEIYSDYSKSDVARTRGRKNKDADITAQLEDMLSNGQIELGA